MSQRGLTRAGATWVSTAEGYDVSVSASAAERSDVGCNQGGLRGQPSEMDRRPYGVQNPTCAFPGNRRAG